MHWHAFWPFARNVAGWIVSSLLFLLGIYYGPKKMLETWDWYMARFFDYKVLEVLEKNSHVVSGGMAGRRTFGHAVPVSTIASTTGMSEKRVLACLSRLKRRKQAQLAGADWKLPDS